MASGMAALTRYVNAIKRRAVAFKAFKEAGDAYDKAKKEKANAEVEYEAARKDFEITVGSGQTVPMDDLYPADMG